MWRRGKWGEEQINIWPFYWNLGKRSQANLQEKLGRTNKECDQQKRRLSARLQVSNKSGAASSPKWRFTRSQDFFRLKVGGARVFPSQLNWLEWSAKEGEAPSFRSRGKSTHTICLLVLYISGKERFMETNLYTKSIRLSEPTSGLSSAMFTFINCLSLSSPP